MAWDIGDDVDGVTLGFGGPQTVKRRVLRKQTADKILANFPLPIDLGPDSFELNIKGLISPASEAVKLWDIVKRADVDSIIVNVIGEPEFVQYTGQYVINRADQGMSKPMFDAVTGKTVQEYNITFVQFTENVQNVDDGEKTLSEPGVGFGDIDLLFGDVVFDTFSNFFPNLFG